MRHKDNKEIEDMDSNSQIIKDAENILIILANQISRGNESNKNTYESMLIEFSRADLNNYDLGTLKSIVNNFKIKIVCQPE